MTILDRWPVFGICGYSGAGKTTLILQIIERLEARGLATLVIKHDAHGLAVDQPGKDSQRFFAAGADVLARDPQQTMHRLHAGDEDSLEALVLGMCTRYDVVLVEGHKDTPLARKVWLRRHGRDRAPSRCRPVALDLGRDEDRAPAVMEWIASSLDVIDRATPTVAGVLMGGRSSRMGRSKHLLLRGRRTWLAHIVRAAEAVAGEVVLLGGGRVPPSCARLTRLPDVDGVGGPLAGMLAAMRWRPDVRWVFLACDTPLLTGEAMRWLRDQARPGIWSVQPRLRQDGPAQPLPGWYDLRAASLLESARGPSDLARHRKSLSPVIPFRLAPAWLNCNTPAELRKLAPPPRGRG